MSCGHVSERSNLELVRCRAYALVTRASSPAQIAQWSPRDVALVWRLCGALVTSTGAIFAPCAGDVALVTSVS